VGWRARTSQTKLFTIRRYGRKGKQDEILDFSGGEAIAHQVWANLDADTLCDRGVIIAGDPESCIAALKKHEATGIDQMMIMMQTENVPHEKVMKSIELFGKYVIPEFKKSESEKTIAAD